MGILPKGPDGECADEKSQKSGKAEKRDSSSDVPVTELREGVLPSQQRQGKGLK